MINDLKLSHGWLVVASVVLAGLMVGTLSVDSDPSNAITVYRVVAFVMIAAATYRLVPRALSWLKQPPSETKERLAAKTMLLLWGNVFLVGLVLTQIAQGTCC